MRTRQKTDALIKLLIQRGFHHYLIILYVYMYGTPWYHTRRHVLYHTCTCYNCLPKDKPSASKHVHVEVLWNKLKLTEVHFVGLNYTITPQKNIWKRADSTELSPRISKYKDRSISLTIHLWSSRLTRCDVIQYGREGVNDCVYFIWGLVQDFL